MCIALALFGLILVAATRCVISSPEELADPPAASGAPLTLPTKHVELPIIVVTAEGAELRTGGRPPLALGTHAQIAAGGTTIEPLVKALSALPRLEDPRLRGKV